MYRLLIVDDESYIVDWVYDLFYQCQDLDLDINKAYSGMEALDFLGRAKVDIVLTDIKMPDMNGLELLQEIKQSWPLCKVIFLTAHDEFEYAHIANKSGVTYLLKTESDEEIIKAVKKAISEIDNYIKQEELVNKAKKQLKEALPIMQREYLMEKIKAGSSNHVDQNQLDEVGINLDAEEELILLIGRIDDWFLTKQVTDRAKQFVILQTIVENFFYPVLRYAYIQLDNSILVWFIQPQQDMREGINESSQWRKTIVYVKGALESIQDQCKKSLGITISFVLDSEPCSWESLSNRFSSLLTLMNYSGINKGGMILTNVYKADDDIEQPERYGYCLRLMSAWTNKIHTLEMYLEGGLRKDYFELLMEIRSNLLPIIKRYPGLAAELYFSVSRMLLTYINRSESMLEKLVIMPEFANLMSINSTIPCEEAFKTYEKISDIIFLHQEDEKGKNDSHLISALHEYIHNNLDSDVSLVKLAELVYLNPAYLSRVYKSITDTNLSDYIYNARMDKAKRLLKESNLKVYEIAQAIGFESVAYFIRSFKKTTGMTPQEFRERV